MTGHFGLQLKPRDPRNLKLGAFVTLPKLEELPVDFVFTFPPVEHQYQSDFCSAFATCYLSELQEGEDFEPSWSFAVSKMLSGDPDSWGQNMYSALKAHTEKGALKKSDAPYSLGNKPDDFLRHISNWPATCFSNAVMYRKKAYAEITGPYDHFDNIRATLWRFKYEKRGALIGVEWGWPLGEPVVDSLNGGYGHALAIVGWTRRPDGKDYLVILNSYGEESGDRGKFYFSREVINTFVERYGSFMFVDMTKEDVQYLIDNGIYMEDNWLVGIAKALFNPIVKLLRKIFT